MSKLLVKVVHSHSGAVLVESARWCSSHLCRLRGLQFQRGLKPGEGLILVKDKDSIANSSIHMFFVFFAIAAVWLDNEGRVVDAKLARPWRPYYAPSKPARYLIEARPSLLERVNVGDQLAFDEVAGP